LGRFERSEEQGEADKTGEMAENRRFFDKQALTISVQNEEGTLC